MDLTANKYEWSVFIGTLLLSIENMALAKHFGSHCNVARRGVTTGE